MKFTLHYKTFARVPLTGGIIRRQLQNRAVELARLTSDLPDPDVSVVIRSRNDGDFIKQLFEDIHAQDFSGKVENGSIWERLDSAWWPLILRRAPVLKKASPGMLSANGSIVKRAVWEQFGGYDERYAGGGEDTALARSMLGAGFMIVREPLCTFFHSHGLGFINHVKQLWHWIEVGRPKPQPFETDKIHARRPDLR